MKIPRGRYRHVLRIERPVADTALDGAGSGDWTLVGETRGEVQGVLPSRGEREADGFVTTTGPARLRIHWRPGITPDMRFVLIRRSAGATIVERILQIVSGPVEIGRRDGLEFMVEDYRPAGNPA